jgi:hypothetical protein
MDNADDAYQRASIILEAHAQLSKSEHHPIDVPEAVILRLLTDLLHYSHERNKGKTPDDNYYIDFEHLQRWAKKEFIKEREAAVELHEPFLDPELKDLHQARSDLEFRGIEAALNLRQIDERIAIDERQKGELKRLGPSEELITRHAQENADQQKKSRDERIRYAREFLQSREIARQVESSEKQNASEPAKERET